MAELSRLLALGIFVSYFLVIIGLFTLILTSWPRSTARNGTAAAVRIFCVLTAISFAHTWYYMFWFMRWSFHNFEKSSSIHEDIFERITDWLRGTELFEQAWALVCASPLNWWWSEQLCLFTIAAWTVFVFAQGQRYAIKYIWAYMLLGQVVAISVASNLFYVALCLSPIPLRSNSTLTAPLTLSIPVFLSLLTVGLTPFTSARTFLPNLLLMHALLIVPLVSTTRTQQQHRFGIRFRTLYALTTILALALRLRTLVSVLPYIPRDKQSIRGLATVAWDVLHSHPAQSSIGWDVVWTTISFLVWQVIGVRPPSRSGLQNAETATTPTRGPLERLANLIIGMTVLSVGVSASDEWRKDEREVEFELDAAKNE